MTRPTCPRCLRPEANDGDTGAGLCYGPCTRGCDYAALRVFGRLLPAIRAWREVPSSDRRWVLSTLAEHEQDAIDADMAAPARAMDAALALLRAAVDSETGGV